MGGGRGLIDSVSLVDCTAGSDILSLMSLGRDERKN
jgi:hypothetical protein